MIECNVAQVYAAYLVEATEAGDGQLHGDRQVVLEATHFARVCLPDLYMKNTELVSKLSWRWHGKTTHLSKHGLRGLGDNRKATELIADGLARLVNRHLRGKEVVAEEDVAHSQGVAKLKAANRVGCQIVMASWMQTS